MANRHTAQTVLASLTARGRIVTVTAASDTTALVDGVRLEFTRTRCTVDGWTDVRLGACSPRGRTVEQINEAIRAALARDEHRRQDIADRSEWFRRLALATSLSGRGVHVTPQAFAPAFTVTVSTVPESALADLVTLVRTRLGDDHA